jgi:hypothetical protein
MPKAIDEALDRDQRERERRMSELELVPNGAPLDFLEAVMRNPELSLPVRMRAAIEAAPYRHPKLSATAIMSGQDFGSLLDARLARNAPPKQIAPPVPHDPAELLPKAPASSDRRFRRA